jgi:hypothetical protein
VNRVPRWRIVAAILVLAVMALLLVVFAPYYFRNLALQNYVSGVTHRAEVNTISDQALRAMVLEKARALNLPVAEDNVHVTRASGGLHIDVRYFVRVNLPGYTVDLHFYPGAGSR